MNPRVGSPSTLQKTGRIDNTHAWSKGALSLECVARNGNTVNSDYTIDIKEFIQCIIVLNDITAYSDKGEKNGRRERK